MDVDPAAPETTGCDGVEVLLARAGWLRVLDDIHGGICHDLNGRASSLDGLLHILDMEEPGETDVMGFIQRETARLAEAVKVLRYLSGLPRERVEAVAVEDLVERAAALHRRHRGLEVTRTEVGVAEGTAPVRTSVPRFLRVLLIVMSHAGLAARTVRGSAVHLWVEEEGSRVSFRVSTEGADVEGWTAGLAGAAEPLRALLAMDGGELSVDDGARAAVHLPALTSAGG